MYARKNIFQMCSLYVSASIDFFKSQKLYCGDLDLGTRVWQRRAVHREEEKMIVRRSSQANPNVRIFLSGEPAGITPLQEHVVTNQIIQKQNIFFFWRTRQCFQNRYV